MADLYPTVKRDTIDKVNQCASEEGPDYLHEIVPKAPSASAEAQSPRAVPSSVPGVDNSEPSYPAPVYPKPGPA